MKSISKLSRYSSLKSLKNNDEENNNDLFSKRSNKDIENKKEKSIEDVKKKKNINSIPINNKPKIKKLDFPSEKKNISNNNNISEEIRKNKEEKN